jgi:hypothetical protein
MHIGYIGVSPGPYVAQRSDEAAFLSLSPIPNVRKAVIARQQQLANSIDRVLRFIVGP